MKSSSGRVVFGGLVLAGAAALLAYSTLSREPKRVAGRARAAEPSEAPALPPTTVISPGVQPKTKAAATAAPPANAPKVETVVEAKWGGRPGELGRKLAEESAPEGPMSFSVDERGRAYVLDQVNFRVQKFEPGHEPTSISLPSDTFQDIALAKNDGVVLLDRSSTASLAFVDSSGHVTHEIGLVGEGISDGGDVTGMFQRSDGTWIEVSHQNLVRVADVDGNPEVDRPVVQGRFAGDGASILRASRTGPSAAFVAQKTGENAASPLARVAFPMPVQELSALEVDARGRIFLGASLAEEGPPPDFETLNAAESVVVLSPTGTELSRVMLPASSGAEEGFRRIRVGADGALYQLTYGETGATLRRVWL